MTTKIIYDVIDSAAVTAIAGASGVKVSSIVYPGTETATDTNGGETINLTGTGFQNGVAIIVGSTSASVVTFISSTQVSFTAPTMSSGTYVIYIVNPDGGTAISIPGISYSGTPTWTTSAGSLGSQYEYSSISQTVTATGDAPITYSLASGTLPTGSTLSSSGTITGTSPAESGATTFSFVIAAKDAQNQTTNRSFSLTINPDIVTWGAPSNNSTYNLYKDSAMANVTLSASSAAGKSITYTANSLPTGLSITGSNIAGTPTITGSSSSLITATAATTGKTATNTINWVISVASDTYFPYVTLLLNGESTSTANNNSTFLDDSTNNFTITPYGKPTQGTFTPFSPTGWSTYFNGSSDYIVFPASSNYIIPSSTDYTIEFWMLANAGRSGLIVPFSNYASSGGLLLELNTNGTFNFYYGTGISNITTTGSITEKKWNHIAVVRYGSSNTVYINGTSAGSTTYTGAVGKTGSAFYIGAQGPYGLGEYFSGYLSNFRIVNGTAVYTSAFTPPTSPLTAITNTTLLTLQSNRINDNSSFSAVPTTLSGTQKAISPFSPDATYTPATHGGSIYFNGSTDYLTAPSVADPTGDFTIEFWWYPTSLGSFMLLFNKGVGIQIYYQSSNMVAAISATNSGTYYINGVSFGAPTISSWNHIAVVRNGNAYTGYLNGTSTSLGTSSSSPYTGGSNFYIGAYQTPNYYTFGYLSNVRYVVGTAVYTSAFTPPTAPLTAIANTSLLLLGTNGAIIDQHSSNNLIAPATSPTTNASIYKYGTKSIYFTGGNYLVVGNSGNNLSFAGDFTIEFWLYQVTSNSGTSEFMGTTSMYTSASSGWSVDEYSHGLRFSYNAAVSGSFDWYPNLTIPMTTWTHIAIVRSGSTITGYLNGTAGSSTQTSSTTITSTHDLWIGQGYNSNASGACTFYLDDFRITNGIARYTSNFTAPSAAFNTR